jgi:transglutaminase-like putative cysteine protease
MAFGQVALGLAGILLGAHQIVNGVKRMGGGAPRRSRRSNGLARFPATAPRTNQSGRTGVGKMRLRTYEIRDLPERMRYLQGLVQQGKRDPVVYEFARQAVNKKCGGNWCVPEKDNARELKALFEHVRKNVRYTSDISGVDSYQKPRHTIALRTADCDDYSVLLCSLAAVLGLPARFKVIKTKGRSVGFRWMDRLICPPDGSHLLIWWLHLEFFQFE